MTKFSDRLTAHMKQKGVGPYDIWKWFKKQDAKERLSENYVYLLCRGEKQPKDDETLQKLSKVPCLGIPLEDLRAWRLLDEYEPQVLDRAKQISEQMESHITAIGPEALLSLAEEVEQMASGQ